MHRRRTLWSEHVPYERLDADLLRALRRRDVDLVVAVTPPQAENAAGLVRACRDAGVGIGLWPMLSDSDGRWANATNAAPFCDYTRGLLERLRRSDALPDELAIDLEPSIDNVRRLLRGSLRPLIGADRQDGPGLYSELVAEVSALGVRMTAASAPMTALGRRSGRGWERLLGTPLAGVGFERVSVMAYSSLLEGYGRGMFARADARSLLDAVARGTADRFGARASVLLGCVGTGALGDEQLLRSPDELAEDVAVARTAGIDDLALYDLGGLLSRPPVDDWLEALCHTPVGARPPRTVRAEAAVAITRLGGHAAALATALPSRFNVS